MTEVKSWGVLVENNMESFVTAPHLSAKCFLFLFFTISGPEIDEITFPPDSPLSTSLYLHRSIHSSFSSSLSHALSSVVQNVRPMCPDASRFFFFFKERVISLSLSCVAAASPVSCVLGKSFPLLFYHCDISHFNGTTAHANTSMLLRVSH